MRAIKRHAFDSLSAHRLWLDVKEDNARARAVYEKEGFRYEGTLRHLLQSGVFIEGWAVYTEWMMCEEGFRDDDPLLQLITLKWYLRDVTNALLDQAIHVDGISQSVCSKSTSPFSSLI